MPLHARGRWACLFWRSGHVDDLLQLLSYKYTSKHIPSAEAVEMLHCRLTFTLVLLLEDINTHALRMHFRLSLSRFYDLNRVQTIVENLDMTHAQEFTATRR